MTVGEGWFEFQFSFVRHSIAHDIIKIKVNTLRPWKEEGKRKKHFCGPSSLCLLFCLLLLLTLFCSHPDTVYPYIFISKSISHQQLEHKQGKDPPTPPGLFENGNVYSLHNVWGRAESSLNPELHFNLIEACHQISGLCFQWLCGRSHVGGMTTKDKTTAYLLISASKWWNTAIFLLFGGFKLDLKKGERIRVEEASFLSTFTSPSLRFAPNVFLICGMNLFAGK